MAWPHVTCGVAQIRVTFDIDAKEVLNASAQDKFTGKDHKIDITSEDGRLPQTETDRMAQEAETKIDADMFEAGDKDARQHGGSCTQRQQHTSSSTQPGSTRVVQEREEEKGRKSEKGKREGQEEEERGAGKETKKQEGKRKRERRDREGSGRGRVKEEKDEKVAKDAMDATIQIFLKVDGMKTVLIEVSPKDKVHDVVKKILSTVSGRTCT